MPDNPLVSFVVLAYKQEDFVREAVQSALAQTYEPLEIIVSDDCSPDGTFGMIEEIVRAYRGPHRVVAKRSDDNLGLAGNFNRAVEMASGELVVMQGGDDVSLPIRTQTLVTAWREPTPVDLVFSDAHIIDKNGNLLRNSWYGPGPKFVPLPLQEVVTRKQDILGCACAFSRRLYAKYGALHPRVTAEDAVMMFRAVLEGGIRFVETPLVRYRVHVGNLMHGKSNEYWRSISRGEGYGRAKGRLAIAREWLHAWDLSGRPSDSFRAVLAHECRQHLYDVMAYECSRIGALNLALGGLGNGLSVRKAAALIKRHVLRA